MNVLEITNSIKFKNLFSLLNGDTYNVSASSAADVSFSHVDAVNKQVTTISYEPTTQVWSKQTNNYLPTSGGKMDGSIDMGANAITNVQKIHVDGCCRERYNKRCKTDWCSWWAVRPLLRLISSLNMLLYR